MDLVVDGGDAVEVRLGDLAAGHLARVEQPDELLGGGAGDVEVAISSERLASGPGEVGLGADRRHPEPAVGGLGGQRQHLFAGPRRPRHVLADGRSRRRAGATSAGRPRVRARRSCRCGRGCRAGRRGSGRARPRQPDPGQPRHVAHVFPGKLHRPAQLGAVCQPSLSWTTPTIRGSSTSWCARRPASASATCSPPRRPRACAAPTATSTTRARGAFPGWYEMAVRKVTLRANEREGTGCGTIRRRPGGPARKRPLGRRAAAAAPLGARAAAGATAGADRPAGGPASLGPARRRPRAAPGHQRRRRDEHRQGLRPGGSRLARRRPLAAGREPVPAAGVRGLARGRPARPGRASQAAFEALAALPARS